MEIIVRTDDDVMVMKFWGKHAIHLYNTIKDDPNFTTAQPNKESKAVKIFIATEDMGFGDEKLLQKLYIWEGFKILVY